MALTAEAEVFLATLPQWLPLHNWGQHPDRHWNTCDWCREMVRDFGPMPPLQDLLEAYREKARHRRRIPEAVRWRIWERDDFTCLGCGTRQFLTIDHRHPLVFGGLDCECNMQTLCQSCNSRKGARLP